MSLIMEDFGQTKNGTSVKRYTLRRNNITLRLLSYGAVIQSLDVPGRDGAIADIVHGYETVADYEAGTSYQGAVIGRHANRIEGAEFELNGVTYRLAANNGRNTLHGGPGGFSSHVWEGTASSTEAFDAVRFMRRSPDGEEGYPGNVIAEVVYRLDNQGALSLDYYASTDQDTVMNLTNHVYFNLAGHGAGSIHDHVLQIPSEFYTPVNDECLPDGEIRRVAGTALDFRAGKPIGRDIDDPMLANVLGYDHNFVVPGASGELRRCALVTDPTSGRSLEVWTTMPGLQLYTGNQLKHETGKSGATFDYRGGFCLETQYFPNAMKHRHFPSPVLKAGETYHHTTVFRLGGK